MGEGLLVKQKPTHLTHSIKRLELILSVVEPTHLKIETETLLVWPSRGGLWAKGLLEHWLTKRWMPQGGQLEINREKLGRI